MNDYTTEIFDARVELALLRCRDFNAFEKIRKGENHGK